MALNTETLKQHIESSFDPSWTNSIQEKIFLKNYLDLLDKDFSWQEVLRELHAQMIENIVTVDIDPVSGYYDDRYKNQVRDFCTKIFSDLNTLWEPSAQITVKEFESLLFQDVIKDCQFYVYGAYKNNLNGTPKECRKEVYLKAVEYHGEQGFRFSENAEAVQQLLDNFIEEDFYDDDKVKEGNAELLNKIAETLYRHIKLLGDKNDLGYVYGGLDILKAKIQKGFKKERLNEDFINRIIRQFPPERVSTDSQTRKQLLAIIESAFPEDVTSHKLALLTSTRILDVVSARLFFDHFFPDFFAFNEVDYHLGASEWKIKFSDLLLEDPHLEGHEFTWHIQRNSDHTQLIFSADNGEEPLLEIIVRDNSLDFIGLGINQNIGKIEAISHEDFGSVKSHSKIITFFEKIRLVDNSEEDLRESGNVNDDQRSPLIIDFIFVEKYKCLDSYSISFTNEFYLEGEAGPEMKLKRVSVEPNRIYGEKVRSLTCIVGKNGSGKTTVLQYMMTVLRPQLEYFLRTGSLEFERAGEKAPKFFAVFTIDEKKYITGDMLPEYDEACGVAKFTPEVLKKKKSRLWEVYDFSNSLTPFANHPLIKNQENEDNPTRTKGNDIEGLKNWSEDFLRELSMSTVLEKEKSHSLNPDQLLKPYQFFCENSFQKLLDGLKNSEDTLDTTQTTSIFSKTDLMESLFDGINLDSYRKENTDQKDDSTPNSNEIDFSRLCLETSSGQFTKLLFFAKIFAAICLDEPFATLFGTSTPDEESGLYKNSRAPVMTLFIDESELYQHPEWQRKFIYLLLSMLNLYGSADQQYQLIISTNSPFFLSDVFSEDLVYQSQQEAKKEPKETFGQNIHTLLSEEFFMKQTIGELSFQVIKNLFGLLDFPVSASHLNEVDSEDTVRILIDVSHYFQRHSNKQDYPILNQLILDPETDTSSIYERFNEHVASTEDQSVCIELKNFVESNRKEIFMDRFHDIFTDTPSIDSFEKVYEFLDKLIEKIGEQVYRKTLKSALKQCFHILDRSESRREFLEKKIAAMQGELDQMEERTS